ncbi:hypothetical protein [Streptacidiphilus sp. MAP5-3]|uniref:LppU/SCO3897 family protein n=1 Tax=unclassified Streptacidiphilus TaxID=2643834 RepID=UPI0035132EE1
MATPPQPPGPGNPYGQPGPYQSAPPPGPYSQPNPYGGQPNPYGEQVPAQANPYAQPAAPQQAPPFPQQGGAPMPPAPPAYGYPQPGAQPGMQPGMPGMQPGMDPGGMYGAQPMGAPAPNGLTCRFCGGYPAIDATVRGHRGMFFVMSFRRLPGPFCKTCGTAAIRDMSAQTLVQGWWGYGSWIFAQVALVRNFLIHNKIKALPEPAPNPPGPPMYPGKPLMNRPQALGFLMPVFVVLIFLIAVIVGLSSGSSDPTYVPPVTTPTATATDNPTDAPTDSPTDNPTDSPSTGVGTDPAQSAQVGDCLKNNGTNSSPDMQIVTCASGLYQVEQRLNNTTDTTACPADSTENYTSYGDNFVLCLKTYS